MPTQDFNSMQAQAIRCAMEMQRKATPPVYPEPKRQTSPPPHQRQEPPGKKPFPPPKDVFSHHNPWTQAQQTPFCRNACPVKSIMGMGSGGSDNDIMMLMSLILLLSADGGDKMLMLALLYIMT